MYPVEDVLENPFEDELNMDMMESIQRHVKPLSESVRLMKEAATSFAEVRSMTNFNALSSLVEQTKRDIRTLKDVIDAIDESMDEE